MARTRAQAQAAASEEQPDQKQTKPSSKATAKKDSKTRKPAKSLPGKRAHEDEQNDPKNETKPEAKPKASKKSKPSDTAQSQQEPSTLNSTLSALLSKYGQVPLQEAKLPDPSRPLPDTLLAFVFNAMLTSARISHELAARSVSCLIDAGYHDIHTLKNSSWEERTEALTKGGYTHYREKTATMLGELADLVLEKYGTWKTSGVLAHYLYAFRTLILCHSQMAISTTYSNRQSPLLPRSVLH